MVLEKKIFKVSYIAVFIYLYMAAMFYKYNHDLRNFGKGSPEDHFCPILINSGKWLWRRRFSKFSIKS